MTTTGKASRFPRSYGTAWRDGLPGLPVVVGLSGSLGELTRSATEITSAGFEIVRIGHTAPSCSVDWRVEGTGGFPVLPEHFVGGVYPEGVAAFAPTATVVPGTISLAAGAAPPTALTGRVVLFDPDKCRIAEGHGELAFSIKAGVVVPGDAIVTLVVPFDMLDPEQSDESAFGLDPFSDNWITHRDHTGGGVTQVTDGIELAGGTSGAGDQENCVAVFSRAQWTGDFTLQFDATKLDDEAPKTGQSELFLLLLFNLSGVSPKPSNLADWPSTTKAGSHTYRDGCRGGRLSLYFQTTAAPGEDKLPSAAVFDQGATSVAGTPTTAFEQRRNVTYHYTITKVAQVVTVAQTGGSAPRSATYDAADFSTFATAGNLGFQVTAGRKVKLENLTISQ